jgi:hypothetical protein
VASKDLLLLWQMRLQLLLHPHPSHETPQSQETAAVLQPQSQATHSPDPAAAAAV